MYSWRICRKFPESPPPLLRTLEEKIPVESMQIFHKVAEKSTDSNLCDHESYQVKSRQGNKIKMH